METARKPRLTPLRGKENKKQLDERMKAAEERRKVKMNYCNEICRTSILLQKLVKLKLRLLLKWMQFLSSNPLRWLATEL